MPMNAADMAIHILSTLVLQKHQAPAHHISHLRPILVVQRILHQFMAAVPLLPQPPLPMAGEMVGATAVATTGEVMVVTVGGVAITMGEGVTTIMEVATTTTEGVTMTMGEGAMTTMEEGTTTTTEVATTTEGVTITMGAVAMTTMEALGVLEETQIQRILPKTPSRMIPFARQTIIHSIPIHTKTSMTYGAASRLSVHNMPPSMPQHLYSAYNIAPFLANARASLTKSATIQIAATAIRILPSYHTAFRDHMISIVAGLPKVLRRLSTQPRLLAPRTESPPAPVTPIPPDATKTFLEPIYVCGRAVHYNLAQSFAAWFRIASGLTIPLMMTRKKRGPTATPKARTVVHQLLSRVQSGHYCNLEMVSS